METKITFKTIIKNAEMACKRDGYPQIVYIENDGEYTFTRLYSFLKLSNVKEVVAVIKGGFTEQGIFATITTKDKKMINTIINEYKVEMI